MLQSIDDLERQLNAAGGTLALYHASPQEVIRLLFAQQQIEAVFINRDYTPFSRQRDAETSDVCSQLGIALHVLSDALLTEPEQVLKNDRTPYKVFTAFNNHARQFPVPAPQFLAPPCFLHVPAEFTYDQFASFSGDKTGPVIPGGRHHAMAILDQLGNCKEYGHNRDYPDQDATSKLSAHLKFGTCSVREVFYAIVEKLGSDHPLLRQLYWRDFFTHIGYHFSGVFGHAFIEKFDNLPWDNNPTYFKAWCRGKTGFPIIDAGMRELNATGFMHNRVRMIAASFLVKDLHIDWRWGERYFAQHLVDYDPCVNNGNWQWAASTGCDAQPYFRIFNPWRQQQKFDPDCGYIYRWLPELRNFPAKTIHLWEKKYVNCDYPAPIVDHVRESRITKERFKSAV